jgi:uncharacterized membrane protein
MKINIILLIVGIITFIFALSLSSFSYYEGGISENSHFTIGGSFCQTSFFLLLLSSYLIGYNLGVINNELKQKG